MFLSEKQNKSNNNHIGNTDADCFPHITQYCIAFLKNFEKDKDKVKGRGSVWQYVAFFLV